MLGSTLAIVGFLVPRRIRRLTPLIRGFQVWLFRSSLIVSVGENAILLGWISVALRKPDGQKVWVFQSEGHTQNPPRYSTDRTNSTLKGCRLSHIALRGVLTW